MKLSVSAVGVVVTICFSIFVAIPVYRDQVRNQWKANAISNIVRYSNDPSWATNEIALLAVRARKGDELGEGWVSDNLILLGNGDWMVYDSICTKQDSRIDDIFIGRGSDGKWYYSTYHFCIAMLELRTHRRPDSLSNFIKDYFLKEFTGQQEEKLARTWPESTNDDKKNASLPR